MANMTLNDHKEEVTELVDKMDTKSNNLSIF